MWCSQTKTTQKPNTAFIPFHLVPPPAPSHSPSSKFVIPMLLKLPSHSISLGPHIPEWDPRTRTTSDFGLKGRFPDPTQHPPCQSPRAILANCTAWGLNRGSLLSPCLETPRSRCWQASLLLGFGRGFFPAPPPRTCQHPLAFLGCSLGLTTPFTSVESPSLLSYKDTWDGIQGPGDNPG